MKKQTLLSVLLLSFMINHAQTFTVPYLEDFDTVTAPNLPQYWSKIDDDMGSVVESRDYNPFSAPNTMILQSGGSQSGDTVLITPELIDLDNTKQIKFQIKKEPGAYSTLYVGTIASPNDLSSFVLIEQVDDIFDFYVEHTINFSVMNNNHKYIAFKHGRESVGFTLSLDNFVYENNPDAPNAPTASINDNKLVKFNIYPNPVIDKLSIESNYIVNNIVIYNISGIEILNKRNINSKNIRINLSFLLKGMYFVKINSNIYKIIKK